VIRGESRVNPKDEVVGKVENVFPELVKSLIEAFDSEERQLIISYVLKCGKPVTFSELQKALDIESDKLRGHLENLTSNYVLRKVVISTSGERIGYVLTKIATDFLKAIIYTLSPKP